MPLPRRSRTKTRRLIRSGGPRLMRRFWPCLRLTTRMRGREELGWYFDLPAGEAAVAYGKDTDGSRVNRVWRVHRLRLAS